MKGKPPKIDFERIQNAIKMSDFIVDGEDYIDCIKNEEDLKKFERLKELLPQTHRPLKECIEEVKEYLQLHRELKGQKPILWIDASKPQLN